MKRVLPIAAILTLLLAAQATADYHTFQLTNSNEDAEFCRRIGEHGLGHPEKSLAALKELTSMFSAEFALRPFITHHFETTFQTLSTWVADPDEHVQRLVSEGCRPRLPWGQQLPQFIALGNQPFQLVVAPFRVALYSLQSLIQRGTLAAALRQHSLQLVELFSHLLLVAQQSLN